MHGRLSDAESGASLPAANIVVEGTFDGAITNQDGEFQLSVERMPATLLFRYIGYESQRVSVDARTGLPLDVRLQAVAYAMPEMVITDENQALAIMRCVIERKQAWRAALQSYSADAYTRIAVSNDTGIVSITESLSEVFWDRERGTPSSPGTGCRPRSEDRSPFSRTSARCWKSPSNRVRRFCFRLLSNGWN